ncbi:putative phage replisome organizer [Clostridium acetobutylicum]|uniref:phage replisome organizer N-terminal domain-containing protein n=1 Tax=Clostridium acetobutylicum TaxID=1488 RepID=UPI001F4C2E9F|nr:phage replisome organizer N-terminal domain-containing protein [Clostridium acetobutylicum]NOV89075.1 putative phage replisome organizer [Clostridium acetobutylicum]
MADIKWIKIVVNIFDDEKIKLIEKMPEADALLVIWFKILCLSGKTNRSGLLMLSDKIYYTDEMLSSLFNRPLNTIRLALETFKKFGMIEIINDAYYITNWEKHQNIETLDKVREQTRLRVKKYREKLIESNANCNVTVTECNATEEERRKKNKNKKEEGEEEVNRIPWQDILIVWNDLPSPIKPLRNITDRRKDKVKARINSLKLTIEDILKAINNIKQSKFLQGGNGKQWIVDFDWIFKNDTNFTKVLEGRYNDKEVSNGPTKPR